MFKKVLLVFVVLKVSATVLYSQHTDSTEKQWRRNILTINVLNLLNNNAHIGYERIWGKGYIGTKLSVNYNFNDQNLERSPLIYQRDFTTGLDFNIYPNGQGKTRYFFGPTSRFGIVSNGDVSTRAIDETEMKYWGVFLNSGVAITPIETIYIGLQSALGIEFFESTNTSQSSPKLSKEQLGGFVAFNIGFKF